MNSMQTGLVKGLITALEDMEKERMNRDGIRMVLELILIEEQRIKDERNSR